MTVKILKPIYDPKKTYQAGEIHDEKTMPEDLLKWAVDEKYAIDVESIAKDEKSSGGLKNLADAISALKAENEKLKAENSKQSAHIETLLAELAALKKPQK